MVELLLKQSADVNAVDRWDGTPLSDAVRECHRTVATLLYTHGGRLGGDELTRATSLCEYARLGKVESVEDLVHNGADPRVANYDGRTPLHVAVSAGHKAVVQSLIAQGCSAEAPDHWGRTPRHEAEHAGHNWPEELWGSSHSHCA